MSVLSLILAIQFRINNNHGINNVLHCVSIVKWIHCSVSLYLLSHPCLYCWVFGLYIVLSTGTMCCTMVLEKPGDILFQCTLYQLYRRLLLLLLLLCQIATQPWQMNSSRCSQVWLSLPDKSRYHCSGNGNVKVSIMLDHGREPVPWQFCLDNICYFCHMKERWLLYTIFRNHMNPI